MCFTGWLIALTSARAEKMQALKLVVQGLRFRLSSVIILYSMGILCVIPLSMSDASGMYQASSEFNECLYLQWVGQHLLDFFVRLVVLCCDVPKRLKFTSSHYLSPHVTDAR